MDQVFKPAVAFLQLADFAEDCKKLDLKAFVAKHGSAFLLHHGPLGKLHRRAPNQATMDSELQNTISDLPFNPRQDFLVFPVKRKPSSRDEVIWVGQSEGNDVIIPDESVSAIHACIRQDGQGRFFIQDMRSRNGTRVDDEPVPVHAHGNPTELNVAAEVSLGRVRMTFLPVVEFCNLVARMFS